MLGEPAFPSLAQVPGTIDLVSIFRKSEKVLPIVKEAITTGAKAVRLQEGIVNNAAAALAKQAGLLIVMDRCWLKKHAARSHRG